MKAGIKHMPPESREQIGHNGGLCGWRPSTPPHCAQIEAECKADSGCHSPLVFEIAHDVFVFSAYEREIAGHFVDVVRAQERAAYGFEGKNGAGVVQAYQVHFLNTGDLIAKVGVEVQELFG